MTAASRNSDDNWTLESFNTSHYSLACLQMKAAESDGSLVDWSGSLASDFLTYAITIRRDMKNVSWVVKPIWWYWFSLCLWRSRSVALVGYRSAMEVYGQLSAYVRRWDHPYRKMARPYELADRLDVLQLVFLRSPFPGDLGRAECCIEMGLYLAEHDAAVSMHTAGSLYCGEALVAIRRKEWKRAQAYHDKAVIVCEESLVLLGQGGDIFSARKRIPPSQIDLARQTGRIAGKIAEINRAIGGTRYPEMEKVVRRLSELTDTRNQPI